MRELSWPDKPIPWQDRLPRSRPLTPRKEAAVLNLNACDMCGDQTYGGSALCEDCAVVVTEREEAEDAAETARENAWRDEKYDFPERGLV